MATFDGELLQFIASRNPNASDEEIMRLLAKAQHDLKKAQQEFAEGADKEVDEKPQVEDKADKPVREKKKLKRIMPKDKIRNGDPDKDFNDSKGIPFLLKTPENGGNIEYFDNLIPQIRKWGTNKATYNKAFGYPPNQKLELDSVTQNRLKARKKPKQANQNENIASEQSNTSGTSNVNVRHRNSGSKDTK